MRTYRVYYMLFTTIKYIDVSAYSCNDAKKTVVEKYNIDKHYILKAVDYKDIMKRNMSKVLVD